MSLKLAVFGQEESSTKLKLEEDGDGGVVLGIVDADGDFDWTLLSINAEGKVEFHGGIADDLGFPVDENGELLIAD